MKYCFIKIFKKKNIIKFTEYNKEKSVAVKIFLENAIITKIAASELMEKDPIYYFTSCFLYHLAFELLFKAILLHKYGSFKKIHHIKKLYKTIKEELLPEEDKIFLFKTLDKFYDYRYSIDDKFTNNKSTDVLEQMREQVLVPENSNKIFTKIVQKLHAKPPFNIILQTVFSTHPDQNFIDLLNRFYIKEKDET